MSQSSLKPLSSFISSFLAASSSLVRPSSSLPVALKITCSSLATTASTYASPAQHLRSDRIDLFFSGLELGPVSVARRYRRQHARVRQLYLQPVQQSMLLA